MSRYEVINVGQGDCILIDPPSDCAFGNEKIFVDLGPGNVDVSKCVDVNQAVSIFLTHHHDDHIGGLKLFASSFNRINKIYIPLYQNEITLIADALLHINALKTSPNCEGFIKELKGIVGEQLFLKQFDFGGKKSKLAFAYEGARICDHIECFNPPLTVSKRRYNNDEMKELARELFDSRFAEIFISYIDNRGRIRNIDQIEEYNSVPYWITGSDSMGVEMNRPGLAFVLRFFIDNVLYLRSLNSSNSQEMVAKIRKSFRNYVHDTCIVLRTNFDGYSMLLTGDASIKVFKRLLKQGRNISADYLKLPHHGSKKNYDRSIIDAINPEVIIISHDNGLFGKAKDPHPNKIVIDDLEDDFTIMITNPVKKNGITIMEREDYEYDPNGQVEIRDV